MPAPFFSSMVGVVVVMTAVTVVVAVLVGVVVVVVVVVVVIVVVVVAAVVTVVVVVVAAAAAAVVVVVAVVVVTVEMLPVVVLVVTVRDTVGVVDTVDPTMSNSTSESCCIARTEVLDTYTTTYFNNNWSARMKDMTILLHTMPYPSLRNWGIRQITFKQSSG